MKTQVNHLKDKSLKTPKRNTLLAMYIAFITTLVVTYSLLTALTYL